MISFVFGSWYTAALSTNRGVGDGVHRRRPDAHGVGRPGDRAGKQGSLRDGHREPQGEEGIFPWEPPLLGQLG